MSNPLNIYLPRHPLGTTISPGSGIVGSDSDDRELVVIDFEGNIYGAENLRTYEQRVMHAAGRQVTKYPTVARKHLSRAGVERDFEIVGTLDYERLSLNLITRRHGPTEYLSDEECVRDAWTLFEGAQEKINQWIQQ